jgi:hypothetical protein
MKLKISNFIKVLVNYLIKEKEEINNNNSNNTQNRKMQLFLFKTFTLNIHFLMYIR